MFSGRINRVHLTMNGISSMADNSPYHNAPKSEWQNITKQLIADHPLDPNEILSIAIASWDSVWSTQIGEAPAQIPLRDINPPATVVGYFFEKIFAKALSEKYPNIWRGESGGDEKDLHYIPDPSYSIEIKSSGQLGTKIFGNRSYGQEVANKSLVKKDKSGYYITVNFYGDCLNLVRFGWIDASDWKAQSAATGQMASLNEDTYEYKLIPLKGDYTLNAPIGLVKGVGAKLIETCSRKGILTIKDALTKDATGETEIARVKKLAEAHRKILCD